VEFCCPSAWSLLSAYMEYELSVVNTRGLRPPVREIFVWPAEMACASQDRGGPAVVSYMALHAPRVLTGLKPDSFPGPG